MTLRPLTWLTGFAIASLTTSPSERRHAFLNGRVGSRGHPQEPGSQGSLKDLKIYAKLFVEAKSAEVKGWFDNDVFDLVDVRTFKPENFVTGRWVLTVKRDWDGKFQKCKARCVASRIAKRMLSRRIVLLPPDQAHARFVRTRRPMAGLSSTSISRLRSFRRKRTYQIDMLDHPALKVSVALIATKHLKEPVGDRLTVLDKSMVAAWTGGTPHQSLHLSVCLYRVSLWTPRLYSINGLRWLDHVAWLQSWWDHTILQLRLRTWTSLWCHRSLEVLL